MTNATQFPTNSREWAKWLESRVSTLERSFRPSIQRAIDGIYIPPPIPGTTESVTAVPDTLALRDGAGRTQMVAGAAAGNVAIIDQLPQPNLIINGAFRVNQRGFVSGSALAIGAYGLDRWKMTSGAGANGLAFTTSPQGGVVTIPSGRSMTQIVERANVVPGQYVLSWTGTASGRAFNEGGSPGTYLPSPVLVTLDGTDNVAVRFNAGTLTNVKLERGTVPTPFILDPLDVETERCERYFWRRTNASGSTVMLAMAAYYSTTQNYSEIRYPRRMRAAPTLSVSSGTLAITTFSNGTTRSSSSVSFADSSDFSSRMQVTTSAGAATDAAWVELNTGHYIQGDAEL